MHGPKQQRADADHEPDFAHLPHESHAGIAGKQAEEGR